MRFFSRQKDITNVPRSPQLRTEDPTPRDGASLMNRLTIAANLLSTLSLIVRLTEPITAAPYLQWAIEFCRVILIILIQYFKYFGSDRWKCFGKYNEQAGGVNPSERTDGV